MLASALVGFHVRTSNVAKWCRVKRRYQVLERSIAESVRAWPLLLAPGEITPGHITKERRLFLVSLIAFLSQTIPFHLHGDFAPLVDHTC
jgi:hypothetical protein